MRRVTALPFTLAAKKNPLRVALAVLLRLKFLDVEQTVEVKFKRVTDLSAAASWAGCQPECELVPLG